MNSILPQPEKRIALRFFAWFLRRFFDLLYHQFSWAYDYVAWTVSLGLWKDWILSVIPYLHDATILELGHGPGHLQIALHQAGKRCFGLDQSKQMSSQARRRLRRSGLPAHLLRARSEQLPFPANSFPQIVVTFPSEYIADKDTLAEIYRVLLPGSSAVVLLLAWITGKSILDRLAAWLFRVTGETPVWKDEDLTPARAAGFIVQSEFITFPTSKLLVVQLCKPN
jgi:ubiquinone/menaquinone biosynthesis C-methylase UbiE